MSKIALRVISVLMIVLGVIALVPTWEWFGTVAEWVGIVEITVGIVGFAIAYSDKD